MCGNFPVNHGMIGQSLPQSGEEGHRIVILTPPYQAELVPLAAGSLWGENACVPLCMCGTSRGLNPTWSMLTLVCILFILSSPHLK